MPTGTATGRSRSIQRRAVAAIEDVETYRVRSVVWQFPTTSAQQRWTRPRRRTRAIAVNRSSHRYFESGLRTTYRSGGNETEHVLHYFVNGSYYERAPWNSAEDSTNWTVATQNWERRFDPLVRPRSLLTASSFAFTGTIPIDGVRTYRLEVIQNESRIETGIDLAIAGSRNASDLVVKNATYTVWISTETYRPVKVAGSINRTWSGLVDVHTRFVRYFEYGTVSISLPKTARNATRAATDARRGEGS